MLGGTCLLNLIIYEIRYIGIKARALEPCFFGRCYVFCYVILFYEGKFMFMLLLGGSEIRF
jgi:hypothetical protein